MDNGFITLHRRLLNWEWISDPNTLSVWIFCLLKANWQESKWKNILIPRGSFICGRRVIAQTLGLTEDEVRTACHHLKTTNNLTVKTTNKYSMYHVEKYDEWQNNSFQIPSKIPNNLPVKSPTDPQQIPTDNNNNKGTSKQINKNTLGFSSPEYDQFWLEYPKKRDKAGCLRIWTRKKLDSKLDQILSSLRKQKESSQWTRDAGQYIPNPSTWLNQERWEDSISVGKEKTWEDMFDEKLKAKGAL